MLLYVIINSDNKDYPDTIQHFPSDDTTLTIYAASSLEKASIQNWDVEVDMKSVTIDAMASLLKKTGANALVFPSDIYIAAKQPRDKYDYISQYPSPPESRNAGFKKQIVHKFTQL